MEKIFYAMARFLKRPITRQGFLRILASGLLTFLAGNSFIKWAFAASGESTGRPKKAISGLHDIVVTTGPDPYENTKKVIQAMGGMERFVKKGATVVVKPNMAWDRNPEQAANTNPLVVAALVELCYQAGAKRVNVFDNPCNEAQPVYEHCGIAKAAKEKGAFVYFVDHWNVVKARFPYASPMSGWPVFRDAVVCDTFINVPVLKHHGLTGLTLSMKNLMGILSGTRGVVHMDIGRKIVDITDFISPELTVIDATRFLSKHGPTGGSLADVVEMNTVFAATDPTLADIFACRLVKQDPATVPYLKVAHERGFGKTDLTKADIHQVA